MFGWWRTNVIHCKNRVRRFKLMDSYHRWNETHFEPRCSIPQSGSFQFTTTSRIGLVELMFTYAGLIWCRALLVHRNLFTTHFNTSVTYNTHNQHLSLLSGQNATTPSTTRQWTGSPGMVPHLNTDPQMHCNPDWSSDNLSLMELI